MLGFFSLLPYCSSFIRIGRVCVAACRIRAGCPASNPPSSCGRYSQFSTCSQSAHNLFSYFPLWEVKFYSRTFRRRSLFLYLLLIDVHPQTMRTPSVGLHISRNLKPWPAKEVRALRAWSCLVQLSWRNPVIFPCASGRSRL